MTEEDAHAMLAEASKMVDFVNFGGICSQLGPQGLGWNKFDNSLWRYSYDKALRDAKWLAENSDKINEAMKILKDNR